MFDGAPMLSLSWKCLPPHAVGRAVKQGGLFEDAAQEQQVYSRITQREHPQAESVDACLQMAALHHLLLLLASELVAAADSLVAARS